MVRGGVWAVRAGVWAVSGRRWMVGRHLALEGEDREDDDETLDQAEGGSGDLDELSKNVTLRVREVRGGE